MRKGAERADHCTIGWRRACEAELAATPGREEERELSREGSDAALRGGKPERTLGGREDCVVHPSLKRIARCLCVYRRGLRLQRRRRGGWNVLFSFICAWMAMEREGERGWGSLRRGKLIWKVVWRI